ncbi:MAG: CvpA family protein [Roseiflexaceae bacterium]
MNSIDLTLLLFLIMFIALGFFQGTIKLLVAIISFYISIILANLYSFALGAFFRRQFGTALDMAQIIAFATLLIVGFLLLTLAGLYTFRYAKFPDALDFIDKIAGTLLGLVLGGFFVGMFAEILVLLFVDRSPAEGISFPIIRSMQNDVRTSLMVKTFIDTVLPLIAGLLKPLIGNSIIFGRF